MPLCPFLIAGDISVTSGMTKLNLNGDSPQFTLTCISTGGPATTVTWTRDSITITEGTDTVLNNAVTAQYTHTLTVTATGEYTCTVAIRWPVRAVFTSQLRTSKLRHFQIVSLHNCGTSKLRHFTIVSLHNCGTSTFQKCVTTRNSALIS